MPGKIKTVRGLLLIMLALPLVLAACGTAQTAAHCYPADRLHHAGRDADHSSNPGADDTDHTANRDSCPAFTHTYLGSALRPDLLPD